MKRIKQDLIESSFRFAGIERDAHRFRPIQIGILAIEHAQSAGNMKAADADLNAAVAQRLRQIERAGKLIRLHADHHDHTGVSLFD